MKQELVATKLPTSPRGATFVYSDAKADIVVQLSASPLVGVNPLNPQSVCYTAEVYCPAGTTVTVAEAALRSAASYLLDSYSIESNSNPAPVGDAFVCYAFGIHVPVTTEELSDHIGILRMQLIAVSAIESLESQGVSNAAD